MNGLLIGLVICHFLGDYTHLSTTWMLNAKRFGIPIFPIVCHALVHTMLMSTWMLIYGIDYRFVILAALYQLISHSLIDITKGTLNKLFPILQNPQNKSYWYIFGLDQTLHYLILILMVNVCSN